MVHIHHLNLTNNWILIPGHRRMVIVLTFIIGQISEIHRFTDFLIGRSPQLHVDSDRLHYVRVVIGWSLKDDGYLAVNVGLGERAFSLPAIGGKESHLDVIWRKGG